MLPPHFEEDLKELSQFGIYFVPQFGAPMALTRPEFASSNYQVTDSDYEVILSAIMETARGRAFLTEYARRNRRADIQLILTEIDKLKGNHSDDLFDFKTLDPNRLIPETNTASFQILPF